MRQRTWYRLICPYNRKAQTQIYQLVNDLVIEDTGVIKSSQYIIRDTFEMMECPQEGCAAWQNGRCCYASVNLNNE